VTALAATGPGLARFEDERLLYLDRVYDGIQDGSVVVLDRPDLLDADGTPAAPRILDGAGLTVREANRTRYLLSGPSTVLDLGPGKSWWEPAGTAPSMAALRATVVHTGMEPLELAEEPLDDPVCGPVLELDDVYAGLAAGRLLAVSGERAINGVPGVPYTEIVQVADVVHLHALSVELARPGDRNHTVVVLDRPLRHCLVRDTVTVAGNVVAATHGETKSEVLGSGDASVAHQRFTLRSGPLTHVPADTPSGVVAELEVRVDDVLWPQRPTFLGLGPQDRGYLVRIGDDQVTTVVGPDGVAGKRFSSGVENVRARYRAGIGRPGNVDAGAITLLATKPLGVAAVVNPVPATGGADPESSADIRRNVAVPLRALDRLVSVPDYADFARAFAGIGKASADRLVVRGQEEILVTVAGAADIPIDPDSALRRSLQQALRTFGDPLVRVRVVVRERLVVRLELTVTVDPDRDRAVVEQAVRAALLDALSFDNRELGQDIVGSEVLATVHRVPGVRRCVIDVLAPEPVPPATSPAAPHAAPRLVVRPATGGPDGPHPAQIAYLAAELPEFLVLRSS
jgi:predicted phage baseplate assembly protein